MMVSQPEVISARALKRPIVERACEKLTGYDEESDASLLLKVLKDFPVNQILDKSYVDRLQKLGIQLFALRCLREFGGNKALKHLSDDINNCLRSLTRV